VGLGRRCKLGVRVAAVEAFDARFVRPHDVFCRPDRNPAAPCYWPS